MINVVTIVSSIFKVVLAKKIFVRHNLYKTYPGASECSEYFCSCGSNIFAFEIVLESCSSPLGHTSDAGPGPDWSWLKNESINQLAITQPKSPSSERLQSNQKSFYFRLSFQTSVELICMTVGCKKCKTVIFKKVSKTLIFSKNPLSFSSFAEFCKLDRKILDWDFHLLITHCRRCCLDPSDA